jgi:phosphonate transport system substrate-binding protein
MPPRWLLGWLMLPLMVLLAGCRGEQQAASFCGSSGRLKVGVVGSIEGEETVAAERFDETTLFALRDRLMAASRCEVEIEPVQSPEQAHQRLTAQSWDLAFLPPGLMAFAMDRPTPYRPVRTLGTPRRSRSAIVVRADSAIQERRDLEATRLGLLPRGSLTGFYLPLYNLHGVSLAKVVYAPDYAGLLQLLASGEVDAIAWDESRPPPPLPLRRVLVDQRPIPLGALVIRGDLSTPGLAGLLRALDADAASLAPALSYVPGQEPQDTGTAGLRSVIAHVEQWSLPRDGQPHHVFSPVRSTP